jgi:lysozyme family protein
MARFEEAISATLLNEGGFVSDPNDHDGGCTNFGITLNFYKKKVKIDATESDLRNLSIADAEKLYKEYYWDRPGFANLDNQKIASRCFDLGVNTGVIHSIAMLQRAVNCVNLDAHLVIDGSLGIKTIEAVNACDESRLYNCLILEASRYYHDIAKQGNNERFLSGWLNRLNSSC